MIRCIRLHGAVCVFWLLVLAGIVSAAARNGRAMDSSAAQQTQAQAKREQLRVEAQKTHAQVNALLTQVLTAVKTNTHPAPNVVEAAAAALENNKQNALAYDDRQRADYMLLQAWTGYFQGNLQEALSWSMRACKQDEGSQDAWISQALFSMLAGRRPPLPRIEKPALETEQQRMRPERTRPQRRNMNANMEAAQPEYRPEPYSNKGILDFDLPAVRAEFFREKFERFECKTTTGQSVEYVPSQDMLCAFFWQSAESVADVNTPGVIAAAEVIDMGYDAGSGQGAGIDLQRQYFTKLMNSCESAPSVKFLQIDMIRPRNLQKLDLSKYDDKGIPSVIAALPESNAQRFACDASTPFMMVIDKSGSVKYSGPAAGFMPAFILTETSGQPISLASQTDSGQVDEMGLSPFGEMAPAGLPGADPNAPKSDPNRPVSSGRAPSNATPSSSASAASASSAPAKSEYDFPMDEAQQQVEAENLLRMGQLKIEESVKIRGSNPRDGIEACRQVLARYPNTPYATQAQMLLRRVPQRYKEEYKITDKELGL
ncbi:MAG: hypothetical protein LLF76_05275 [Planctomycetaceae bacterium]|nr:hypothetical protein [Planctomycetaceae bacterium]